MTITASLSIIGENFDPNQFKEQISIKIDKAVYKGQHRHNLSSDKIMTYSYVHIDIGNLTQKQSDWNRHIAMVTDFLKTNKTELSKIHLLNGVDYFNLDISTDTCKQGIERFYFPTDLVHICSELNISIETSLLISGNL